MNEQRHEYRKYKNIKKTAAPEGDLMPRASLASSAKLQASLYIINLIILSSHTEKGPLAGILLDVYAHAR